MTNMEHLSWYHMYFLNKGAVYSGYMLSKHFTISASLQENQSNNVLLYMFHYFNYSTVHLHQCCIFDQQTIFHYIDYKIRKA